MDDFDEIESETPEATPDEILEAWVERDLTAAAEEGQLEPAFELDGVISEIEALLGLGRCPVLAGEPGVGKTAAVHELVRRLHAGIDRGGVGGRRVLQVSFRRRAAALKKADEMGMETSRFVSALGKLDVPPLLFIRDLHLAYAFNLETQLQDLPLALNGPLIGEGERNTVDMLLEDNHELEATYVVVPVAEPSLTVARRIVGQWAERRLDAGQEFTEAALDQSVELSHRFLARSRLPRKALDLLRPLRSATDGPIGESEVMERFCQSHRIPRDLVDPAIAMHLPSVREHFGARLLGQTEAVDAIVAMVGVIKAGLSDPRRPFGVFMFVGPTGVGKTHLAQTLAEYLFGSRERLIRLNMADYQKPTDALVLFGDPSSYSRRARRGALSTAVGGQPFGVLLLDEFEKAAPSLHDRFLQLFDEGSFVDGAGQTVVCRSMIVIATSNAGAEVYRAPSVGFAGRADTEALDQELDRRLTRAFRWEFLNRFDRIVHFHPLSRDSIRKVAQRELEQLADRGGLKRKGLSLELDDSVFDWLTAYGYHPLWGARFLKRTIERQVTSTIAGALLATTATPESVALTVRGGRVVAEVRSAATPAPGTANVTLSAGRIRRARALDREGLLAEIGRFLHGAAPRLEALDAQRTERSRVLERMNEEGCWDDPEENSELLERYRELDVAVRMQKRFAGPINGLATLSRRPDAELQALVNAYYQAADALDAWDECLEQAGPAAVWLVVSNADPMRDADGWPESVAEMELQWCRRLGLNAELVAAEMGRTETVERLVLEVEGPGAWSLLEPEAGLHRLHAEKRNHKRVTVQLVARDSRTGPGPRSRPRSKLTVLGAAMTHACVIELPERGIKTHLVGLRADTLTRLAGDLTTAWTTPTENIPVARHYRERGAGARDPRTGATAARFKDVMSGRLEGFLDAWRQYRRGRE